jgi:uncharacterized protein YgiM (DUF1202 family)
MRWLSQNNLIVMLLLTFSALLLGACAGNELAAVSTPTMAAANVSDVSGSMLTVEATAVPRSTAAPQNNEPRLPAIVAAAVPTAVFEPSPTPVPTPTLNPTASSYEVAFVLPGDTLNVRSGPGIEHPVVAELEPGESGLEMAGPGAEVAGALWVPVTDGEMAGWVNSSYLTGDVTSEAFCNDPAVEELLEELKTAVIRQDGAALAQLVHPQRNLRLRVSWWNPEIIVPQAAVDDLFNSTVSYEWGTADGSGLPITGSFAEVIYPLLQQDIAGDTITGCDVVLGGPTTGLLKLPDPYEGVRHISIYRQGQDETQFDWGAWTVGIEQWQGTYYLSFLVHYAYEI